MAVLADVAQLIMGQSPPSSSYNDVGEGLPFFQGKVDFGFLHPAPRKYCTKPKKVAEAGDILMSVRAPVGPTNICTMRSCIGRGLATIRPTTINGMFLYYNLQYIESKIAGLGTGSTFKAINKSQLAGIEVNTNEFSRDEQRKMAAVLSLVQRAIEQLERLIQLTAELKKTLMHKLFTEGTRGEPQKRTQIGPIPKSWKVEQLSAIARIERGKFTHRPRNEPRFYGGDIPFVQTGDVSNCDGHIRKYTQTLNEDGLAISRMFPAGTILITIAANIGYTGILCFDSACPDSLIAIIPNDKVEAGFLNYYLTTQQSVMDRLAPRGTQKNINIQFLKPWLIPVPSREEQFEIAAILDRVDSKCREHVATKNTFCALFRTLLHQLMTAKVRVNKLDLAEMELESGEQREEVA